MNPYQVAFTLQQLEATKQTHLAQAKQAKAAEQFHLAQAEEACRRINLLTQQFNMVPVASAAYSRMSPPSSLSSSQQMFQQPMQQNFYEDSDIPDPRTFQLPRPLSESVTEDQLTEEQRQLIEQDVQEKEPDKAQVPVEAPKIKAPVEAPNNQQPFTPVATKTKKQQPTYAQKAQESVPKTVTEVSKPVSKYPQATSKKSTATTFTNKQRNQKAHDDKGFMTLQNEEDVAEMFEKILPGFHEKRVNGSAEYLHKRGQETHEIVTHPDKNFNATAFIKGVDLDREVNITQDSELDEKDEKLSRMIYEVMENFYGNTKFYINRIWTSPFADTEYNCLNISICVFFTKDEKAQIMDKLQQLRKNKVQIA